LTESHTSAFGCVLPAEAFGKYFLLQLNYSTIAAASERAIILHRGEGMGVKRFLSLFWANLSKLSPKKGRIHSLREVLPLWLQPFGLMPQVFRCDSKRAEVEAKSFQRSVPSNE
jgi:hypothetical protein